MEVTLLGTEINLKDLFVSKDNRQHLYCDGCGASMVLGYFEFNKIVSGIQIQVDKLPCLCCEYCGKKYLSENSRFEIIDLHVQAMKDGVKAISKKRKKINEKFRLGNIGFNYDSDDYYNLPGLERFDGTGFLTPVFFNKAVLLKFRENPDYRIRFHSQTYGSILKGENFCIPFGVNKNGKVFMWLGDIASLPKNEQFYLKSENINSDHDIGSEFYDGQIESKFTDSSVEDKLIDERSTFLEFCHKKFELEISHLNSEILDAIEQFSPPLLYTEKEQKDIIDLLHKINIESIDNKVLGKLIIKFGGKEKDSVGSLKRLEKLFKINYPELEISKIITPLYVLYDLRVLCSHASSKENNDKVMKSVCNRLDIPEGSLFSVVYSILLEKLINCYRGLTVE